MIKERLILEYLSKLRPPPARPVSCLRNSQIVDYTLCGEILDDDGEEDEIAEEHAVSCETCQLLVEFLDDILVEVEDNTSYETARLRAFMILDARPN